MQPLVQAMVGEPMAEWMHLGGGLAWNFAGRAAAAIR